MNTYEVDDYVKDHIEEDTGKKALRTKIKELEADIIEINQRLTSERLRREDAEAIIKEVRANGPRVTIKAEKGKISIVAVVAGVKWGPEYHKTWTIEEFRKALGI